MTINLNEEVRKQINKAVEAAGYLWSKGWAERNGGNISLNLTELIDVGSDDPENFRFLPKEGLPIEASGNIFFVSGSGERLRELRNPEAGGGIIRINNAATGYHLLWGGKNGDYRVTSEFIPHLKIHMDQLVRPDGNRAVIHTHPIELVCLAYHPEMKDDEDKFNNAIWQMITEVRFFIPRGVGLIPYALPGSEALAKKTTEVLRTRDLALWEKHGVVARGRDALEAFDFIDVANKGAMMYLKCLQCGYRPEGLSDKEMAELFTEYQT